MAQPAEFQSHPQSTELPVGEILRRTRIHYNKSIGDVQEALRIRSDQIQAIEQNDNEKLPAPVYAIGFVRSYSEFLGLDGNKMVALYKAQSGARAVQPNLDFPVAAIDSKVPPFWLALVCLVIFIAAISLYVGGNKEEREAVETIPAVPAELKPEAKTPETEAPPQSQDNPESQNMKLPSDAANIEATTAATPPPAATEQPAAPPVRKGITLKVKENSWVEISDGNDKKILSRVLKAGEKYFIPERANLTMSIGNAGGVQIEVDGEPLQTPDGTLGPKGEVMRKIPLNGDTLKERFVTGVAVLDENPIETLAE